MAKLSESQFVFAKNVAKLINYIFECDYYCTLGEAWRTKEQAEIYHKAGRGIINSQHCKRLAIDLNLFSPEGDYLTKTYDYVRFGNFWERLNPKNRWGGKFNDGNHFEMENL